MPARNFCSRGNLVFDSPRGYQISGIFTRGVPRVIAQRWLHAVSYILITSYDDEQNKDTRGMQ